MTAISKYLALRKIRRIDAYDAQLNGKSFEHKFRKWLNKSLGEKRPENTIAFSFNLFIWADQQYGVELVGTNKFDVDDSDWACEEIFRPKIESIRMPLEHTEGHWESALELIKNNVQNYLNSDDPNAKILNTSAGVGVGFVDGDLHLVKLNKLPD
ncbi:MAG: hypothetical protein L3J65_08345 [Robiginitomaculum sp.]|nr:hypothetical protein [Robiginitomaculum sp.]